MRKTFEIKVKRSGDGLQRVMPSRYTPSFVYRGSPPHRRFLRRGYVNENDKKYSDILYVCVYIESGADRTGLEKSFIV